jgi:hypothetical protein
MQDFSAGRATILGGPPIHAVMRGLDPRIHRLVMEKPGYDTIAFTIAAFTIAARSNDRV